MTRHMNDARRGRAVSGNYPDGVNQRVFDEAHNEMDDFDDDETCGYCGGFGGGHDCGEDTCCCLDPEPNVPCDFCGEMGDEW